jgi:hypothetical protein
MVSKIDNTTTDTLCNTVLYTKQVSQANMLIVLRVSIHRINPLSKKDFEKKIQEKRKS